MSKQKDINKALSEYLKKMDIGNDNRAILKAARTAIRQHLRQNFPIAKGKCKFMTQGSFQYKTINLPCHPPKQHMDLDDGIYIPRSCVSISPQEMLDCLAGALRSHANIQNGKWELSAEKPSCMRILIARDKHIDIPLYCAPDEEMETIKASAVTEKISAYKILEIQDYYHFIEGNFVELAHKKDGWVKSDPRVIFDWFADNVEKYGENYINVCRILKGWRDNQWPQNNSPLTSILIMRIVELAFEKVEMTLSEKSLDDSLFLVSQKLESIIKTPVTDPDKTRDGKLNDFDEDELKSCISNFVQLENTLNSVLYEKPKDDDIKKLCEEFGGFFPDNSNLIIISVATSFISPAAAASEKPRFYGG